MKIKNILRLSLLGLFMISLVGCNTKTEKNVKKPVESVKDVVENKVFASEIEELRQVAKDNNWDKIYDTKVVEFETRDLESEYEYRGKLDPGNMGATLITKYKDTGELVNKVLKYNKSSYSFVEETDEVDFRVASSLPDKSKECLSVRDLPKNVVDALNDPEEWKLKVVKNKDQETEKNLWHIEFERSTIPYYHVEKVELEVTDTFYVERAVFYCGTNNCERFGKESYIVDVINYSNDKIVVPEEVLEREKKLEEQESKDDK